jgi:hypothetical protein
MRRILAVLLAVSASMLTGCDATDSLGPNEPNLRSGRSIDAVTRNTVVSGDGTSKALAEGGLAQQDWGYYECHEYPDPPPPEVTFGKVRRPLAGQSPRPSQGDLRSDTWECHWVPDWEMGPGDPPPQGGGNYIEPPDMEEDPYYATNGSLWYDVVDGSAMGVPNCSLPPQQLTPIERAWCAGEVPNSTYTPILNAAATAIIQRCAYLSTAWSRVQGNIRLFNQNLTFGGGSRKGDNWLLLSYEWADSDPQLGLVHELLHVLGYDHPPSNEGEVLAFRAREMQCSGGRQTV